MLKIGMEICRDVGRPPAGYFKLMSVYSHLSGQTYLSAFEFNLCSLL